MYGIICATQNDVVTMSVITTNTKCYLLITTCHLIPALFSDTSQLLNIYKRHYPFCIQSASILCMLLNTNNEKCCR